MGPGPTTGPFAVAPPSKAIVDRRSSCASGWQADWVELEGFLVADDPDGDGLIGFCWTKIHRGRTPVLGEIYVIGVDPSTTEA